MFRPVAFVLLVLVSGAAGHARQAGFTRTPLTRIDLSAPGREAITARAEFAPGVTADRHTHFGEEVGYIVSGTLDVEIDGTVTTMKAGQAFTIAAGKPHRATNVGTEVATIVATYIVEKGKPLATPAK